jgi:peroxiredoxin (alkyl hydroperoxide reductase subunit C)
MKVAADRMEGREGPMKCYDWFFCTRELPKEEVEKKLGLKS